MDGETHAACRECMAELERDLAEEKRKRLAAEARAYAAESQNLALRGIRARQMIEADYPDAA